MLPTDDAIAFMVYNFNIYSLLEALNQIKIPKIFVTIASPAVENISKKYSKNIDNKIYQIFLILYHTQIYFIKI